MKTSLKPLALGALLGISGIVDAATITSSALFFQNPSNYQTTDISQTLTLDLFNTSLGTLNGVSLTLGGGFTTNFDFTNTSPGTQIFTFNTGFDYLFTSLLPGLATFLDDGNTNQNNFYIDGTSTSSFSVSTGSITLPVNSPPGNGATSSGPLSNTTENTFLESTLNINWFTNGGPSTFDIQCDTITETSYTGGGGNIDMTQNSKAGCWGSVTYTYTPNSQNPVPEPETLALLGLGLMGMAWRRRLA